MNAGDIVRVSEESMHYDMFAESDLPPIGILLEIDHDNPFEKYLVEFTREENFLHDGGQGDEIECRYWIDELELVEALPDDLNEEFFADEQAGAGVRWVNPRPERENVLHFIDDFPPDIDFDNEIMHRFARLAREHAADIGLERPIIRRYGDYIHLEEPNEQG